jgi:diguanylate cyclase
MSLTGAAEHTAVIVHRGDERAAERDRRAEERDLAADRRDRDANLAAGVLDLREHGASDRRYAASDRAVAAADRHEAGLDRLVAASEREDAEEERKIFMYDELTGLLQRGAGLIALEREAARSSRSGDRFVVAFLDIDGLKRVNDRQGHGAGDELLRTLGEALLAELRSYDTAMRYGGDEFVCILPGADEAGASTRFHALQARLAAGSVLVSVTVGLASWRPGEDTDDLLARADAALYDVRRSQRGEVE